MKQSLVSAFMILLVLPGCSMLSSAFEDDYQPEPPTVASIEDKPVNIEDSGNLDASRQQAIDSYRKFLNSAEQNRFHAEAMRRIADLELEELEARAADYSGQQGQQATRPEDYQKVVRLYNNMLKNHPDYPNNDGVLYQLAKVHEQAGEIEQALAVFDRLVRDYPRSQFITEVQFRRGEILFVLQRFKQANNAYQAVLNADKNTPFYQRALYKHGWTEFKRSRYEEGLNSFFALLDIKFTDPDTGQLRDTIQNLSRGDRELMQDSFRVISLSFSYLDGPRSIDEYFTTHADRPYSFRVYRNLGNLYMKQERIRDAADTYNAFVRSKPDHRMAPDFQSEVINAYKKGGFLSLTLEAKEEFAERYNTNSRYWQIHSEEDKARIAKLLQTHLEDLARYYHAQAQKEKKDKKPLYRKAARWYRMFVNSFPQDPKTPQMHFLLAEVLFESGDYLTAAREYENTAYNYGSHGQQSEAGYAAILAFKQHEQTLPESQRNAFHVSVIDNHIRFVDNFPNHKHTAAVTTAIADDLYKSKQLDRAEVFAKRLLAMQPTPEDKLRRTAWTVLAHTQFEQGRYAESEQSYTQVLALTPINDKQYDAMHERMIASIYKQGEASRDQGDLRTAVSHFLRLGKLAPKSDMRPIAEYDAAASLIQLKDWQQAAQVLEDFRRRYPKHELASSVPDKLALVYLSSKQNDKAAGELERIAKNSKDPTRARESRLQAAELYEQANVHNKAIQAYTNYFTLYPQPFEQAIEARNKVAEIYKKLGNQTQYQSALDGLVKAEARGGSGQRTARTRFLAATAAYQLAEPVRKRFRNIRLTIPLKRSLKQKKDSMKQVLKAYENIARYNISQFTTAATYQIAEVYNEFSRDLMSSQRPANLKADELELYDILLEEQAFPFEEKAIATHETNASRTVTGVYDEWVKKSLARLAKLQPIQYNKTEKSDLSNDEIR